MQVFEEKAKPEYSGKTSQSREENQQTQPNMEVLCISIEPWQNKIPEEKTSLLTSGGSIVGACLSLSSFDFFSGGGESDSCPT